MKNVTHFIKAFLMFIIMSSLTYGQSDYYWHNDDKIFLEEVSDKKCIVLNNTVKTRQQLKQLFDLNSENILQFTKTNLSATIKPYKSNSVIERNYAIIQPQGRNINFIDNANVLYEAPFYRIKGNDFGLSRLFFVKLFKNTDIEKLETLANKHNVQICGNNKFMPLWFTLECTKFSDGNALKMANLFHQTGLFASSQPDLLIKPSLADGDPNETNDACDVNDPYFYTNQWNLSNWSYTEEVLDDFTNIENLDINACQAWKITKGDPGIKVALFDVGVQKHEDISNFSQYGYDIMSQSIPAQIYGYHGTACAGIISAEHNDFGIAGIAPNVEIIPISFNEDGYYENIFGQSASGFNFAIENDVDIINNSWTLNIQESPLDQVEILNTAINNALTQGRDGRGCIIVFASGNGASSYTAYPANSNPLILNVGSVDSNGERSIYSGAGVGYSASNYGPTLDVVAPGESSNIATCGVSGTYPNYDEISHNYMTDFDGTSAAAPHVAGVAALLLSVNPELTVAQVNDIIQRSAQKVRTDLYDYEINTDHPSGTWNIKVGHGLVDAYHALLELCNDNIEVDWEIDDTLHIKANNSIMAINPVKSYFHGGASSIPGEYYVNAPYVTFGSGDKIVLKHGFHAEANSKFHATLDDCDLNLVTMDKKLSQDTFYLTPKSSTANSVYKNGYHENDLHCKISPNPVKNQAFLDFNLTEPDDVIIYLRNGYGVKIKQVYADHANKGQNRVELKTNDLSPGLYFCVIITNKVKSVVKIVKI